MVCVSDSRCKTRSQLMAAVRQRGTTPELAVRRCLRELGLRPEYNRSDLPGSPDLVVQSNSLVVFVHGCFWHRHRCRYATTPKTNQQFWQAKFAQNKARDVRNRRALRRVGWRILVVWECWTRDSASLQTRILTMLNNCLRGADGKER